MPKNDEQKKDTGKRPEKKELRKGFTTGTCAAAAAKAAVRSLLGGAREKTVSLMTPGGIEAVFEVWWPGEEPGEAAKQSVSGNGLAGGPGREGPGYRRERLGCRRERPGRRREICAVRKDAGDDPDVTDGALVYAAVWMPGEKSVLRKNGTDVSEETESGEHPGIYCDCREPVTVYIGGGRGIGRVTKRGLKCPPGYPAINPVPRRMIADAVREVLREYAESRPICVEISIPDGERLAEKTFNPHLGIVGGISVLGTTGIVNPMSEEALLETIRLDIQVHAAEGRRLLAVAPGNYGAAFLLESLGLSMESFVKCSNFVGETFQMLKEAGIREVLFAGHLGKLVKVAGGVMNTHSKYGDRRMEILADCVEEAARQAQEKGKGFESFEREGKVEYKALAETVLSMNTTDEAAELLKARGVLAPVMEIVTGRIKKVLEERFGLGTEVIVFSGASGILGMTGGAEDMAERLRKLSGGPDAGNR